MGGSIFKLQGAPIKNNPFYCNDFFSLSLSLSFNLAVLYVCTTFVVNKRIHYLNRFFAKCTAFTEPRGFVPHMQQISSQYLLWFKNYNHLNLKVQFY